MVAQRVPDLQIVIDHLGKPPITAREFEPWSSLLARAARLPNVFAKVSGLDAGPADHWTAADIAPYIDRALELFGSERLMFGSDWPGPPCAAATARCGARPAARLLAFHATNAILSWAAPRSHSIACRSRLPVAAMTSPSVAARVTGSPADFGKLIAEETEKWATLIQAAQINAD